MNNQEIKMNSLEKPSKEHLITPEMTERAKQMASKFIDNAIAGHKRMQEDPEYRKQMQAQIF